MHLDELRGQDWIKHACMIGIDEAGRGPVIGPMVYGAAFAACSNAEHVASLGFNDSKQLTEEKREALYTKKLCEDPLVGYFTDALSASAISQAMLGRSKTSLNQLAVESTARLIQSILDAGVNVAEAYVDTVGTAERHAQTLSEKFPGIKFTVESKADARYPICGAASIADLHAAKVTRDRATAEGLLEEPFPEDKGPGGAMGSGYPSDPATQAWLAGAMDPVFGYPSVVRFSWATCERALEERAVKVKWEAEEDEDEAAYGGGLQAMLSKQHKRHSYFRSRQLLRPASILGKRGQ